MDDWLKRFEAARARYDEAAAAFHAANDRLDKLIGPPPGNFVAARELDDWLVAKTKLDEASRTWTNVALEKRVPLAD